MSEHPGDAINAQLPEYEKDHRRQLFARCRNGEPEAVAELARDYDGARIWTHEEVAFYNVIKEGMSE